MRATLWVAVGSLATLGVGACQLGPGKWLLPDLVAGRITDLDPRFAELFAESEPSLRVATLEQSMPTGSMQSSGEGVTSVAVVNEALASEVMASDGTAAGLAPPGEAHRRANSDISSGDEEPGTASGDEATVEAAASDDAFDQPEATTHQRKFVVATRKHTWIRERPNRTSKKLGYLRSGAVVQRYGKPIATDDCPRGYLRIDPMGFVCSGRDAVLDERHPAARAQSTRPVRGAALPYEYGLSRGPAPHQYTRIPTAEEQAQTEPDLGYHLDRSKRRRVAARGEWMPGEIPWFLAEGQPSLRTNGTPRSGLVLHRGRALPKSGFAFLELFESEGRQFGLTTDLFVVPLDRVERVEPSEFHGLSLLGNLDLPVAFTRSRGAYIYRGHPTREGLKISEPLPHRQAVPLTGEVLRGAGQKFLATRDGRWIVDQHLLKVEARSHVPNWVTSTTKWIDVSINDQTLVAYRGTKPEFVTLVSTGIGGLGDPEEVPATVQGHFRIHTKHVTISMSSDEEGDEFDLSDVPYTQYFKDGYALHAAYWHDGFGTPKSHGCVNLSPLDARWLFGWTDPPVPQSWHGAMSLLEGTQIYIHP